MNRRFYVTATVALLLAAAYNGAEKRSDDSAATSMARDADVKPAEPAAAVTARSLPATPPASRPRS